MSERRLISSGSAFEAQIGYSRAVVIGDWVFVSGCTGYDYKTGKIDDSIVSQADQAMKNVASALEEAGSSMNDVVRVRYILTKRGEFPAIWDVLKSYLGDVRPAATMIEAGLMDADMKFEVEVTARKLSAGGSEEKGEPAP